MNPLTPEEIEVRLELVLELLLLPEDLWLVLLAASVAHAYGLEGTGTDSTSEEQKQWARVHGLCDAAERDEAPLDYVLEEDEFDYVSGEPLLRGSYGYILDNCKRSALLRDSLARLVDEHRIVRNPLTNLPIQSIQKVHFV